MKGTGDAVSSIGTGWSPGWFPHVRQLLRAAAGSMEKSGICRCFLKKYIHREAPWHKPWRDTHTCDQAVCS